MISYGFKWEGVEVKGIHYPKGWHFFFRNLYEDEHMDMEMSLDDLIVFHDRLTSLINRCKTTQEGL